MVRQTRNSNRNKLGAVRSGSKTTKENLIKHVFGDITSDFDDTTVDTTLIGENSEVSINDPGYLGGVSSNGQDITQGSVKLPVSSERSSLLFNAKRSSGRKRGSKVNTCRKSGKKGQPENKNFTTMTESIIEEEEENGLNGVEDSWSLNSQNRCRPSKDLLAEFTRSPPIAESTRVAFNTSCVPSEGRSCVSQFSCDTLLGTEVDDKDIDETLKAHDSTESEEEELSTKISCDTSNCVDGDTYILEKSSDSPSDSGNSSFNVDGMYDVIKKIYINFKENEKASEVPFDELDMEEFKLKIKMALRDYCREYL